MDYNLLVHLMTLNQLFFFIFCASWNRKCSDSGFTGRFRPLRPLDL